jgi:hypothetical protein
MGIKSKVRIACPQIGQWDLGNKIDSLLTSRYPTTLKKEPKTVPMMVT